MNRKGFSLIECMVYIAGLSMIALIITQFTNYSYNIMSKNMLKNSLLMTCTAAGDALAKDLQKAPPMSAWLSSDENNYCWQENNTTVRWHIESQKLIRTSKKRSSVVGLCMQGLIIVQKGDYFQTTLNVGSADTIRQETRLVRIIL